MCGIAGQLSANIDTSRLDEASIVQIHRGPDAQNYEVFKTDKLELAFIHQRLSIIDLAQHSNQPFKDGRTSIIYNGEVYNYIEIREELEKEGIEFTTSSDTEVVLKSINYFGLEKAVSKFNGMWAFAHYDASKNILSLSRDRFGIKPLYYHLEDNQLSFSSEIKTIHSLTRRKFTLNYQLIGEYIDQAILEGNQSDTFYNEIKKLPPGHNATIDLNKDKIKLDFKKYYSLKTKRIETKEIITKIKSTLSDAINLRLRSDVPVGVLLSGGLDSSSIATIANQQNKKDVKLLSYVSDDKEQDESFFIDSMGKYLKKDITKVRINIESNDVLNLIRKITHFNDQPIHSFSALAHYLLMKEAKDLGLTVILSGQGADESLCGYRKYTLFYIKNLILNFKIIQALIFSIQFLLRGTILNEFSLKDSKRYLPSFLKKTSSSLLSNRVLQSFKPRFLGISRSEHLTQRQIRDIMNFSVPSLLHYEDRMSMANSREIRVPFLDHNVVELFLSLPINYKLRNGWTKFGLRESMKDLLPDNITWRKDKKGFTNPQSAWLKNELKDEIKKILNDSSSYIFKQNLINQEKALENYSKFCNGDLGISEREVFAPIALNIWLECNSNFIEEKATC